MNRWTTQNKIVVAAAILICLPFTWYATELSHPTWIYRAVTAFQISLLFFSFKKVGWPTYTVMVAMVWYTLFWTVRDAFMGFYVQQSLYENIAALAPAVLALTWYRWPDRKSLWWKLIIAAVVHVGLCLMMVDTDNELLAVLVLLCLGERGTFNEGLYFGSLFWYQFYIATSKYMPLDYPDKDVIYFVALTPFLVANVAIFIKRTARIE